MKTIQFQRTMTALSELEDRMDAVLFAQPNKKSGASSPGQAIVAGGALGALGTGIEALGRHNNDKLTRIGGRVGQAGGALLAGIGVGKLIARRHRATQAQMDDPNSPMRRAAEAAIRRR